MSSDAGRPPVRFEPLRPASRHRLIVAVVLGPMLWAAALITVAIVLHYTYAIELGLMVTVAAFLVAAIVLPLLHAGRERQERRYVDRG